MHYGDVNQIVGPARDGVLHVFRAARLAGARRIVMTSSFAAIGYGQEITSFDAAPGELRLYGPGRLFLGLGKADLGGVVRPSRLFTAGIAGSRN